MVVLFRTIETAWWINNRNVYMYGFVSLGRGTVTVQSNKGSLWHISSQPVFLSLFTGSPSVWLFSLWMVPLKEKAVRTLLYKEYVTSQRNQLALRDKSDFCRSFSLNYFFYTMDVLQPLGTAMSQGNDQINKIFLIITPQ